MKTKKSLKDSSVDVVWMEVFKAELQSMSLRASIASCFTEGLQRRRFKRSTIKCFRRVALNRGMWKNAYVVLIMIRTSPASKLTSTMIDEIIKYNVTVTSPYVTKSVFSYRTSNWGCKIISKVSFSRLYLFEIIIATREQQCTTFSPFTTYTKKMFSSLVRGILKYTNQEINPTNSKDTVNNFAKFNFTFNLSIKCSVTKPSKKMNLWIKRLVNMIEH